MRYSYTEATPRAALLTIAPSMTMLIAASMTGPVEAAAIAAAAAVMWSPLPFSFAALLTQNERDAAMPDARWHERAVWLLPHLILEARCVHTIAATAGWALSLPVAIFLQALVTQA